MAKIKKIENAKGGEDVEQPRLSYTADGSISWQNHFGNCFVVSIKTKRTHILDPANLPLAVLFPPEMCTYFTKKHVQNVQSSTSHNSQNRKAIQMPINARGVNSKNGLQQHARIWINLTT